MIFDPTVPESRQIDASVAVELLGYRWYRHVGQVEPPGLYHPDKDLTDDTLAHQAPPAGPVTLAMLDDVPFFCWTWGGAGVVIQSLESQGYVLRMGHNLDDRLGTQAGWHAVCEPLQDALSKAARIPDPASRASAPTLPEAICLVALSVIRRRGKATMPKPCNC